MSEEPGWDGPLPEAVRLRVVAGPPTRSARCATTTCRQLCGGSGPGRRSPAYPGSRTPLAAAVEHDVVFRQRVASAAREALPDLVAALDAGAPPAAADPVDVAAVAYLGRTPGWAALVGAAADEAERATAEAGSVRAAEEVARLEAALAAEQARHAEQVATLRVELTAATAETAAVTQELREEKGARRRAERAAPRRPRRWLRRRARRLRRRWQLPRRCGWPRPGSRRPRRRSRRPAGRCARAAASRTPGCGCCSTPSSTPRPRCAASWPCRRSTALPADLVDAAVPGDTVGSVSVVPADDPALLDQLVSLPQVHLIVDGYNVTKTGYPELSLEKQRTRLLMGLSNLAARSGAEVTCCFDGAALQGRVPAANARGVRVLFSKAGETADELIRRLVRAEPEGRPVIVVSCDQEVADGVRRSGARPVAAAALVRRLDRA